MNDCSRLIIPVINEVFGEHYTGKEAVVFAPNEHYLNQQDGKETERVTDSSFKIMGKEPKKYHLECQSSPDHSMLIRFFEYDTQIALDEGEIEEGILTVTFPHSAVLFLRHNAETPERLKTRMVTPGGSLTYEIPVMKSQNYTVEEIFEKKLWFLLPFYIFTHEKRLEEYEQKEELLGQLKEEYEEIRGRLEELLVRNEIDEYTKCTIIDMANKVVEHLAKRYENVKEGVKSVMGGKILEYEAKTIRNEGRREGRKAGIHEGRLEMLMELVDTGLLSLSEAARQARLTEEAFEIRMREHRV